VTNLSNYYTKGETDTNFRTKASTGLVFLNTTSFSAASSVSLAADTFSSAYDNYRLVITLTSTATTDLRWRGRTSGSDNTTTNYVFQILEAYSSSVGASRTGPTTYGYAGYSEAGNTNSYILDIINPKATQPTNISSTNTRNYNTTSPVLMLINNGFNLTTSFDSLSFYPGAGGTITGTYSIYGYND
jgi:hypothetical protein